MAKKKLPEEIFVYECDCIDGEPIYSVARNIDEIDQDSIEGKVGIYKLHRTAVLNVKRSLT